MMVRRSICLVCLGFSVASGNTQMYPQRSFSHGTINIILGNGQGLVVETDSQLSSGGIRKGFGQKLFKIDDHTVCAIAGFYIDSGPNLGGNFTFPIQTAIPEILNSFVKSYPSVDSLSIEAKLAQVASLVTFGLGFVTNADRSGGLQPSMADSQITIAGYDRGILKIARTDLKPEEDDHGVISYKRSDWPTIVIFRNWRAAQRVLTIWPFMHSRTRAILPQVTN